MILDHLFFLQGVQDLWQNFDW